MTDTHRCTRCGVWFSSWVGWCSSCFGTGTVVAIGRRSLSVVDAVPEVFSARDLVRAAWQVVAVPSFPSLVLGRGGLVVVHGAPGMGKSTFVCRSIDSIRGPVVLASVEEPPGPSLAARLLRAGVRREDFVIVGRATVDQLVDVCRSSKAVALAIDSVQPAAYEPRDLRHLLAVLPSLETVWAVAQQNAEGRIAGVNSLAHEADVVIECRTLTWTVTKSRYAEVGTTGPVLRTNEEIPHAAA